MRAAIVVALFMSLLGCNYTSSVAEDKTAITQVVQELYGGSETPLVVDPIVMQHPYGIADWVQGNAGGRTLLHKVRGTWTVMASAGSEMRDAKFLMQAGLTQTEATALTNQLIDAERQMDTQRIALLDRFGPKPDTVVAVLDEVIVQAE